MISKRLCIALLCVLAVIFTGYAQVSSKDKKPAPEQPAAKQETTLPATDGKEKKQETAKPAADAKTPKQETTKPAKQALPYVIAADDFSNLQLPDATHPVFDARTLSERISLGLPVALPTLSPYYSGKTAYLTFDDGPDDEVTKTVLDILAENNVKATFYVTGINAATYPDTVRRMVAEGHAVGNHSYDHDYDRLYTSPDAFLYEMVQTDEILYGILGFRPLILRAPGGTFSHFTSEYEACLEENGYVEHDWNVSIADTASGNPTAQDFIDNVMAQTADGKESAIILMHSSYGHQETAKALPEIIRVLRERGYRFGVVTPMTPQPW
ncbi:MAG: polysaccharide deacetylase family protein [Schwartzia sp.]|nr:polysaccharide deacetylase family protein [Schwartzia sp. (in: firmicutes)]